MRIMRLKGLLPLLLACMLVPSFPALGIDQTGGQTVRIATAEDFLQFSERCSLDSWSIGKYVVLEQDIDLSGCSFTGVPTFGGSFDGQGHTVTGLSFSGNGSTLGLFRYLQKRGLVKNLHVSGTVTPGGSNSYLGGIVGQNSGKILQCSFEGKVVGSSSVGAIAGLNTSEGVISDCRTGGTVYGEHYAGGIAGKNLGTILSCTNEAQVNTVAKQVSFDLEKLDLENLRSTQNVADITDVGGITGFSSGILQSCINTGAVGYERVGYNIGGIAGRQSGYVDSCTNYGPVLGRKDVGGITGQMEPFTALQYSQSSLDSLDAELEKLQRLADSMLDRSDGYLDSTGKELRQIKDEADGAIDETKALADQTGDLVNEELDSVNDASARLTAAIDEIGAQIGRAETVSEDLDSFLQQFQKIVDQVGEAVSIDTEGVDLALDHLTASISKMQSAGSELSRNLVSFRQFLNDAEGVAQAAVNLLKSIENLKKAMDDCQNAVSDLRDGLADLEAQLKAHDMTGLAQAFAGMTTACDDILQSLQNMKSYLELLSNAFSQLNQSLIDWNPTSMIRSIQNLSDVLFEMQSAMNSMKKAVTAFREVLDGLDLDQLEDIPDQMREATASLEHAVLTLGDCFLGISETLQTLGEQPIITFQKIDEESFETLDRLHEHILGISSSLDRLERSTEETRSPLMNELRDMSSQIKLIFENLTDVIPELSQDPEDHFVDISEEDTAAQTTGKVSGCRNIGEVRGEVNTGGITGSMAIEYDFDPEDDVTVRGERSVNFLYTTRAIVRNCRNEGAVTGKKNNVGGVAGNMALGCIISSQSSGEIKSSSGDFVGGIAGLSDSVIKNCASRSTVAGDDYVGGIAGKAKHLLDCRAVPRIKEGDESLGAVAGEAEGNVSGNVFCSDFLGGIDSVSYSGKAEPVEFGQLSGGDGGLFQSFRAEFWIDGEQVKVVSFPYEGSISQEEIPRIPEREGYYATWDAERFSDLTYDFVTEAHYYPYVTALEGAQTRENGLAVVVAQGNFEEDTSLSVMALQGTEQALEGWQVSSSDGSVITSVHYLAPEGEEQISVLVDNGKNYRKVPLKKDGRYLVFEGGDDTLRFLIKTSHQSQWKTIGLLIGGLLILIGAIWLVWSKRKRRCAS